MTARLLPALLALLIFCPTVSGIARGEEEEEQAAVVARRFNGSADAAVRIEVDPQDGGERLLVLSPGGPLLVDVELTIDGQPFRVHREKLVDEMLAAADTDGDGEATWKEALDSVRFTMNRIRFANDEQRGQFLKALDADGDGQVDRVEARRLMARYNGGAAFVLNRGSYGYRVRSNGVIRPAGDVKQLLDRNSDGGLSQEEIAAAPERLKAQDANDNDLLESTELRNEAYRNAYRRNTSGPRHALLLGPTARADDVFEALKTAYGDEEGRITPARFTLTPALFEQLDRDADGLLEEAEVLGLNDVQPHARLALNFGKRGDAPLLKLAEVAGGLGQPARQGDGLVIFEVPGFNLQLVASGGGPPNYNFQRSADAYLSRYDTNKNGYIEKDEMAGNLARNFQLMDGDADGKVYAKEIVEMYQRQFAPRMSQVSAIAAHQGNSLLEALDTSGDGRLSLREMKTAPQRLAAFDKDQDGQLAAEEIPATLSLSLARAGARYGYVTSRGGAARSGGPGAAGPDWFVRMDRNGDGDVTLREFLGTAEQFKMLDTNGDGFIEPKEAEAAGKNSAENAGDE